MATTTGTEPRRAPIGPRASVRAALDVMLTDAALERSGWRRFLAPGAAAKAAAGLARRPARVAAHAGSLASQVASITAGRSELAPAKGDRRFADRGWQAN